MSPFLFWIFALLTLIFGAAVVINRNPVASALSLVVSFLGLAALFMSLDAYFIGIIQVLVYAGAVMVLFLYVIHNLKSAQQPFPPLARSTFDDVRNVGLLLFGSYNLPFQIIGVLVLVATIGVVLLSKREPR